MVSTKIGAVVPMVVADIRCKLVGLAPEVVGPHTVEVGPHTVEVGTHTWEEGGVLFPATTDLNSSNNSNRSSHSSAPVTMMPWMTCLKQDYV